MSSVSFVTSHQTVAHPVEELALTRPIVWNTRVLTPLTKEESDSALSRTVVQGSPYLGYTLTPHHLRIAGMEPAYETCVDGRRILFARSLIPLKGDRLAVMA